MTVLEDLIKPVTTEQIEQTMITTGQNLGLTVTTWNRFGISRTLIKVMARSVYVWCASVLTQASQAPYLGYARGGWLTLLSKKNYGVTRVPATIAGGVIQITNARSIAQSFAPGELTVAHAVTGKTYRNTTPYTSAGMDTVGVMFSAEEAGSASSAAAGSITKLVRSVPGLTVNNPSGFTGADEETDAALEARTRLLLTSLSPLGAAGAYRYVLTSSDLNPTDVPITRVTSKPDGMGGVSVYVATSTGTPTPSDIATCQATIERTTEPQCIVATVQGADPVTVNVSGTVTVLNESLSDAAIVDRLRTAAEAYIDSAPIGGIVIAPSAVGRLDASMLRARLATSLNTILDLEITSPAADIAALPHEVFQLGTVAFSVVRG